MNLNFEHNGATFIKFDRAGAEARGVPEAVIAAAETKAAEIDGRGKIREKIEADAGDSLSLLGTTADVSAIAILVSAALMVASNETSYASFKASFDTNMAAIAGDKDPVQIATDFLASLAAGTLRVPALEKGIVTVLDEVSVRSTAVAEAMAPVAPA